MRQWHPMLLLAALAAGACDSHGKLLSVPYSADYAFYTKNKGY